jgi:hypothetical protein
MVFQGGNRAIWSGHLEIYEGVGNFLKFIRFLGWVMSLRSVFGMTCSVGNNH